MASSYLGTNYSRPDTYILRDNSAMQKPISSVSTSVAAIIGVFQRGVIGKPVLSSSWTDFIKNTSRGLDSPFMENSDATYASYGFYANGGVDLLTVRVGSTGTKVSTGTLGTAPNTVTFNAGVKGEDDPGVWSEGMSVVVTANADGTFNLACTLKGVLVETLKNVSNTATDAKYFVNYVNSKSNFYKIPVATTVNPLVAGTVTFSGGADGLTSLSDASYLGTGKGVGLEALNKTAVRLIAIPGQDSVAVQNGLLAYAGNRGDCFAVLGAPVGSDVDAVKDWIKTVNASDFGAFYYPAYGYVTDALSTSGIDRLTSLVGHIMGVYARTDSKRGVNKAPAGVEAVIKGVNKMETTIDFIQDVGVLNDLKVNSVVVLDIEGICIWGVRTLSTDDTRKYISDVRMDITVEQSCKTGTRWVTFEPNDEILWSKIVTALKAYLGSLWKNGQLKGTTADEAYYVKCDAELNDQDMIDAGFVIAEIGYAKTRPNEFFVIRVIQKRSE